MPKRDSLRDFSHQNDNASSIAAAEHIDGEIPTLTPPPLQLKMEDGKKSARSANTATEIFSSPHTIQRRKSEQRPNFQQSAQSSSSRLPVSTRSKMEQAFQTDFSSVKIHQNSEQAAQLSAKAFTQGNDIHFAGGTYQPNSSSGQELIGHELSHVVQQRSGNVEANSSVGGIPINDSPSLEAEADLAGKAASKGETVQKKSASNAVNSGTKAIQGWGIPDWVKDAGDAVGSAASSAWDTTQHVVGSAASSVADAGESVLNGAKSVAKGVAQGAVSAVKGVASGAKSAAKGIMGGISSAGKGILSGAKSALKGVGSGIRQGVGGVLQGAKQAVGGGINAVRGMAGSVRQAGSQLFDDPMGAASTLWNGAKSSVGSLIGGVGSGIRSAAGGMMGGIKTAGSGVLDGIGDAAKGVLNGLKEAGGGILTGIKKAGGGLLSGIGSALFGMVKGGLSLVDAISEVTVGFADKLMGPEGEDISQSEIPSEHAFDEYMTDLAYLGITNDNDLTDADKERLTRTGYDPSTFYQFEGQAGFQMVYVLPLPYDEGNPATHEARNPAIAIRGSEANSDFFKDWGSDFDFSQVGNRQFEANKDSIESVLQFLSSASPSGKVNLSGHSLGGALAQIITAHHPSYINRLTTFQAPGISQETADLYEQNTADLDDSQLPEIAHHIVEDGLVYKVGETSLEGDFYKHNIDESFFGDVHVATLVDQEGRTDSDGNHQAASRHAVEKFESFPDDIKRKILEFGRKGLSPIVTRLFNLIDGS